jgi:hypothetical protein
MGNKSSIQIAIKTNKNYYYPGEEVFCSVYIESPKPEPCSKIVIQI